MFSRGEVDKVYLEGYVSGKEMLSEVGKYCNPRGRSALPSL